MMSDLVLAGVIAAAWVALIGATRRTRPGGWASGLCFVGGFFLALAVSRVLIDRGAPVAGLLTGGVLWSGWMVVCPLIRRIRYRAF